MNVSRSPIPIVTSRLFLHFVFMLILTSSFIRPGHAKGIEPYDFGSYANEVTKAWNEDLALYVAKRFAADNGLDSNAISIKRLNAGATNHFIYLMYIHHQLKFVIKGLGTKNEAEALHTLQHSPKRADMQNNPRAAVVTFSKIIHSYQANGDEKVYYFAILEAASGKEVFKIMQEALLVTHDIATLKEMFYQIGQQTSELHKSIVGQDNFISPKSLVSVIHDDLHPENAFYDCNTHTFSLIDNESMGASLTHPLPLIRELYGFYEIPVIRWPAENISVDLLYDANPHDLASIYYQYILGMASVYQHPEEAKQVFIATLIELNNMAIDFLKNRFSKPWMQHPKDKHQAHIVWGKLSHAIYNPRRVEHYINNLTIINEDLQALASPAPSPFQYLKGMGAK